MSLHPRQQVSQSPLGSDYQVSAHADDAHRAEQGVVGGLGDSQVIDGFVELSGADSLDAVGRAFAELAHRRAHERKIRQRATVETATGETHE